MYISEDCCFLVCNTRQSGRSALMHQKDPTVFIVMTQFKSSTLTMVAAGSSKISVHFYMKQTAHESMPHKHRHKNVKSHNARPAFIPANVLFRYPCTGNDKNTWEMCPQPNWIMLTVTDDSASQCQKLFVYYPILHKSHLKCIWATLYRRYVNTHTEVRLMSIHAYIFFHYCYYH